MLHIFMGALDPLLDARTYERFGTLTPDEMAAAFLEVLETYDTVGGECMIELGDLKFTLNSPSVFFPNWLLCDGGDYLKADYPEYWQMLVDTGKDGTYEVDADTFEVPMLIERFIYGTDEAPHETGGEATHTLTIAEIPAHTHTVIDPGVLNAQAGTGAIPLSDPGAPTATGSAGGGGAHNNIPPYFKAFPMVRVKP
jgi:microcystin-dependent protein